MKATYIKTQLKNLISITKIVTIHYYEFDKSFSFAGESHDFWEMVYVDKGAVCVMSEDEEIVLSQGDVIFHKPNEFHAIKAHGSEPNFFVVSFVSPSPTMALLEKHHGQLSERLKPFISAIIKEADMTFVIPKNDPALKKLQKKENAIIGGEQLIKTYLEQLLILLIREKQSVGTAEVFPSKKSMESHLIDAVKKHLERNVREKISIADVCRHLGYSKSYLCKLFRAQTGCSIIDYGVKAKITLAKRMIRENNLNFSQISDALSFDNPQYFSRVFRRVTGMSPTEFKQTLRLEE